MGQKLAPFSSVEPQAAQRCTAGAAGAVTARALPQLGQKRSRSARIVPQPGQVQVAALGAGA